MMVGNIVSNCVIFGSFEILRSKEVSKELKGKYWNTVLSMEAFVTFLKWSPMALPVSI